MGCGPVLSRLPPRYSCTVCQSQRRAKPLKEIEILDDAAEDARVDDLEHLLELGRVARLLEGQEQAVGLAGGGDHTVEFGHAPSEGFFADGVVAGVEGIDGGLRMEMAGQGVDD